MKETEEVLEILVFTSTMVGLITSQYFSALMCCESFRYYISLSLCFFHEALESYFSAVQ
jgi:hypothetical protein